MQAGSSRPGMHIVLPFQQAVLLMMRRPCRARQEKLHGC